MFYSFEFKSFPEIHKFYTVVRNTVWETTDPDNLLIIVSDGQCRISCETDSCILNRGEAFFVPANHSYKRCSIDGRLCTMYYIHFAMPSEPESPELSELTDELGSLKQKIDNELIDGEPHLSYPTKIYLQSKTVFPDFDKIDGMLRQINLFSAKRQIMCNLQSSISLCGILSVISQLTIEDVINSSDIEYTAIPSKLKSAIGYITRHYSEKITLDEISRHCNVSKQQLIRYFKQYLDTTPIAYINEYKLNRAKDLLLNSPHLLISEIASELGFNNQYYFTKLFTQVMGETPSAYRFRTVNYDRLKRDS